MSITYLLPQKGEFYKANLHSHTTLSDGSWTPQQLKDEYQKRGYSVIAITDHMQYNYHKNLNTSDFVCLAATEININTPEDTNTRLANRRGTYHLNFYDTAPETRPEGFQLPVIAEESYYNIDAINKWLAQIEQQGFLSCYNHPYWSLQDWRFYAGLKHIFAMEIYNHGCELDGLYGFAPQVYDEMLAAGQNVFPFATDDNHNSRPPESPMCDSFGGFNMIKAENLSYAAVIEALRLGDFYASNGPQIEELYVEDGHVKIKCSRVQKIYLKTAGRRALACAVPAGQGLTEAEFSLDGVDMPFRMLIEDEHKNFAATRQYSIKL